MIAVNFYVKAGMKTGYGHIVRNIALADELTARGCECAFYSNAAGRDRASAAGHATYALDTGGLDCPNVWVIDLEGGCSPSLAASLKEQCDILVILNGVGYPDGDLGRLVADLVFYQGCTLRPVMLNWTGFKGKWFEGVKWLILRREFRGSVLNDIFRVLIEGPEWIALREEFKNDRIGTHFPARIVIAAGGSDPRNVTSRILSALKGTTFKRRVIIGPAYQGDHESLRNATEICSNPPNMAEALSWADIAIVSYGMTAFECLALGIPTIALSISPDHAASAQLVQERSGRALRNLGEIEQVTSKDIAAAIDEMLSFHIELSERACAFIDGRGAERVADKIIEKLK